MYDAVGRMGFRMRVFLEAPGRREGEDKEAWAPVMGSGITSLEKLKVGRRRKDEASIPLVAVVGTGDC
jgi:hypothetical protein